MFPENKEELKGSFPVLRTKSLGYGKKRVVQITNRTESGGVAV